MLFKSMKERRAMRRNKFGGSWASVDSTAQRGSQWRIIGWEWRRVHQPRTRNASTGAVYQHSLFITHLCHHMNKLVGSI
jgi:hypothetical protein